MNTNRYRYGHLYYQFGIAAGEATPWPDAPESSQVLSTWVYGGPHLFPHVCVSCDVPHQFYVFFPYLPDVDVLAWAPERGSKHPSMDGLELSLVTFPELVDYLMETASWIDYEEPDAYQKGHFYYQLEYPDTLPWSGAPHRSPVISSWVYCGVRKESEGGNLRNHHWFQRYYPFSNPDAATHTGGLSFASLEEASGVMRTFVSLTAAARSP